MKNRLFIGCIISLLISSLVGCGANSSEDDNYANYSQIIEDTSIDEISEPNTTITTQSDETTSQTTDSSSNDTSDITAVTSNVSTKESTTTVVTTISTKSTSVTTTISTTKSTTTEIEPQEQDNSETEQSIDNQDNQNNTIQPIEHNFTIDNPACFDANDMYLSANNGYSFTVDMSIEEVIANLGDNYTLESAPSCYYDGDDRIYIYDDFSIYTYTLDGVNYYSQEIEITSDNISTSKGIKIGSSLSDVESAYGSSYQVFGNEYRFYVNDNTYFYFFLFDNIVDSLGYRIEIEV